MAYDEGLAERLREVFRTRRGVIEKRMFGGVAFMVRGYMAVGIVGDALMARVGPDQYDQLLRMEHVRPMDFTGSPMKGYVYVAPAGLDSQAELEAWVDRCVKFVGTLPPR
jgi:TfoX/Sxy family transcriptional regulator of competence genes